MLSCVRTGAPSARVTSRYTTFGTPRTSLPFSGTTSMRTGCRVTTRSTPRVCFWPALSVTVTANDK